MKKVLIKSIIFLTIIGFFVAPVSVLFFGDNGDSRVAYAQQLLQLPECPDVFYEDSGKYYYETTDFPSETIECEPPTANEPGNGSNGSVNLDDLAEKEHIKLKCGVGNIGGCVVKIFYLFWKVSAWITVGAGKIFDMALFTTISSSSYKGTRIMEEGWSIVRDFVNIIFIFALLYLAFATILGLAGAGVKKQLIKIILAAIFINFSLFISYAIIDSGNILAHTLYNKITIEEGKNTHIKAISTGEHQGKDIALVLTSKINPQKILSKMTPTKTSNTKNFFLVLTALFTNIVLLTTFISLALFLILRTVMLWVYAIFAPIAFASYAIKGGDNYFGDFGAKNWWTGILGNAFLAPILLFFLYLIILFLEIPVGFSEDSGTHVIVQVLGVIFPLIIVIILLNIAKKQTKKLAGTIATEMAAQVSKYGKMAIGGAVGVATGGASLATGATGALISKIAGDKNRAGRRFKNFGGWMQTRDYSKIGKSKVGQFITKQTGVDMTGQGLGPKGSFDSARGKTIFSPLYWNSLWEKQIEESEGAGESYKKIEDEYEEKIAERKLGKKIKEDANVKTAQTGFDDAQKEVFDHPDLIKEEEKHTKQLDRLIDAVNSSKSDTDKAYAVDQFKDYLTTNSADLGRYGLDARHIVSGAGGARTANLSVKNYKNRTLKNKSEKSEKKLNEEKQRVRKDFADDYVRRGKEAIAKKIRSGKIKGEVKEEKE